MFGHLMISLTTCACKTTNNSHRSHLPSYRLLSWSDPIMSKRFFYAYEYGFDRRHFEIGSVNIVIDCIVNQCLCNHSWTDSSFNLEPRLFSKWRSTRMFYSIVVHSNHAIRLTIISVRFVSYPWRHHQSLPLCETTYVYCCCCWRWCRLTNRNQRENTCQCCLRTVRTVNWYYQENWKSIIDEN
jgi:hypothetical protein